MRSVAETGLSQLYNPIATYGACPFFGYGAWLRKERKAESRRPHRSCFRLQSFRTIGRAEVGGCRRWFARDCCRIFLPCRAPSSEQTPWEGSAKILRSRSKSLRVKAHIFQQDTLTSNLLLRNKASFSLEERSNGVSPMLLQILLQVWE